MLGDLLKDREKKLKRYANEADPYPAKVRRDLPVADVLRDFDKLERAKRNFFLAGRIFSWRDQGKIIFADLEDGFDRVQLVLNEKNLKNFKFIKETLDVGDFVEAKGSVFKTKRGERSLLVKSARLASKSLRPIPATWYGLDDTETRLRKRYLDLLVHKDVREMFVKKSVFWGAIRDHLKAAGFLEVETPVLEAVPGGAETEPFVTHHNALDRDFHLRISLELPLKRLLVGGFGKVFEIGRIFRNEGIDKEHLQDYTQMECYWAYEDYEGMMAFIEKLYKSAIKETFGTLKLKIGGNVIDWGKKWPKVDYYKVFKNGSGLDLKTVSDADLLAKAKALKLEPEKYAGRGRLVDIIYKKTVRPNLIQPCFLIDPPVEIEPLAKRLKSDPGRVARFQIMAAGTELGKGFSELNDSIDQRKRFEDQMSLRAKGDREAQQLDEDFLEALEYGMPPAAGFGMSERLFAVLIDKPVRETVFFPLMKGQTKE
jgi:lysyl-tRNA synthetase, class II